MAPPPGTPKTMSSRLATMKFMQRSANSTSASAPSPSTPNNSEPPSKKQRLSNGSTTAPSPLSATRTPEQQAIEKALAEEERKRSEAVDRQARAAGETKWVLEFQEPEVAEEERVGGGLQVVRAGFGAIDAVDEGEDGEDVEGAGRLSFGGRKNYGNFKSGVGAKGVKRKQPDDDGEEDSSGNEDESDVDDDDDPTSAMIKEERKLAGAKVKAERKVQKSAEKSNGHRNNNTRGPDRGPLAQSGGISSGGRPGHGGGGGGAKDKDCYKCGEKGHIARECPNPDGNKRR